MGGGLRRERSLVAKKERAGKFAARKLAAVASTESSGVTAGVAAASTTGPAPGALHRSPLALLTVSVDLPRSKAAATTYSGLDLVGVVPFLPPARPTRSASSGLLPHVQVPVRERLREEGGPGGGVSVVAGRRPPGGLRTEALAGPKL